MGDQNQHLDYLLDPIVTKIINSSEPALVKFDAIRQTVKPLLPNSLFPSFDYVDSEVADILDAVSIVLLLWNVSSIVSRLIFLPFRNSSKSLAIKYVFDNLVSVNICAVLHMRANQHHSIQSRRRFLNWGFKLIALLSFITVVLFEVLLIFSQTLISKELGLESSGLRSLTWDVPTDGYMRISIPGCVSISESPDNSVSVPLFLCEYLGLPPNSTFYTDSGISNSTPYIEFQVQILEDTVFHIAKRSRNKNRNPVFLEYSFNYTIELHNVLTSEVILANLTRLGFQMTEAKRNYLQSALHDFCECTVTYEPTNFTFLMKFSPSMPHFEFIDANSRLIFHAMIQLSGRDLQKQDFLYVDISNSNDSGWSHVLSNNFVRGRVKRVSGFILWIFAVFFIVLNVALQFLTRDLEEVRDNAVRSVLEIPSDCDILSSKNVRARLVNERVMVESNPDNGIGNDARLSVLRLRRRD
ncbi:hypothetical protein BWQ96_05949 [Gracilariopsis chorda]|uniref:Uncharacterized protein n=1 Tax=Gracilariopsis chorda TaxID=448386 RepID=A0A2V3IQE3_9FLOR|nr:hypothetical protein BWQ96_05949 [Gracilariopsis chorda]|eukprot:PXF44322.1 hypothetical protein BWQ96_05949 [Gracilariopsis chorda]